MSSDEIRLELTCGACPEQYDAWVGEDQVGYLRLRHGYFAVYYPDAGGELIYDANPNGDGIFEGDERDRYLAAAKAAIAHKLRGGAKHKVVLVTTEADLADFPPEAWESCEQIVVSDEQFNEFVRMLADERPARALPRLAELFARPTVFEGGIVKYDDAIKVWGAKKLRESDPSPQFHEVTGVYFEVETDVGCPTCGPETLYTATVCYRAAKADKTSWSRRFEFYGLDDILRELFEASEP